MRIDTAADATEILSDCDNLRIRFVEPQETELIVTGWRRDSGVDCQLHRPGEVVSLTQLHAAVHRIVEAAIPFETLGVRAGDPLSFFVELFAGGQSHDRTPNEGTIDLRVPQPNFESLHWQA